MTKQIIHERKPLGKKIRFEVFKRDGFKCQYCGASAPEAILEVDHINPVSKGGGNDMMNLITSCKPCNAGKTNVELSDDAAIQKQRAMLDELSERREQLEMMLAWRDGMKEIEQETLDKAVDYWRDITPGFYLNETGIKQLKALLRRTKLTHILDAMDVVASRHLVTDEEGALTAESVGVAWSKVASIAKAMNLPESGRQLLYIRGICRNRFSYCNDTKCLALLKQAHDAGVDIDTLTAIAKDERNWTNWQAAMYAAIDEA
ncbi:HNH endonuclease [Castellaniella sp.]|uniref:HNH endonuclease n=1 Tax=Castellaniella sp. TaxID=1955812 RepID=UPI002B003CF3|nr:HNH endonuclease [Castellaniella sp.]